MKTDYELIQEYLKKHLHQVLKQPYGNFKHPFIDPGSVYDGNLWDWDTFWAVFAMINLAENGNEDASFKKH